MNNFKKLERFYEPFKSYHNSRGLKPGSKVCLKHMDDWQYNYISLGVLEQKLRFSCALTLNYGHVTCHVQDQKLKIKEIGELVANILCFINKLAFLKKD